MRRLKAYFGVIFETWQARKSLGFRADCSWGFARAAGGALRCVAFRTAPRGLCRSARLRNGTTKLNAVPRACRLEFTEADVFGTGRLPSASQGLVVVDAICEVE